MDERTESTPSSARRMRLASTSNGRWAAAETILATVVDGSVAPGAVTALCALPDGRLASGSDDGTIQVWDPDTGTEVARIGGHSGAVRMLCALPDGRLASASRDDSTIRLWDPNPGSRAQRSDGHSGAVCALCALPDGRIASGSSDNTIRLWDPNSHAGAARLDGRSGAVKALCALPDGRLASSGSKVSTIQLWDHTGAEAATSERSPRCARLAF
jgi:WD40 repeat protein